MNCYKCGKEKNLLMRGMCIECFKAYNDKESNNPVDQFMGKFAEELIKDPEALNRPRPDYKAQRDELMVAIAEMLEIKTDDDFRMMVQAMKKISVTDKIRSVHILFNAYAKIKENI